ARARPTATAGRGVRRAPPARGRETGAAKGGEVSRRLAPAERLVAASGGAPDGLPLLPLQTLSEELDYRSPRAVRHFGLLARAQESVPHPGIDRVVVVLRILLHRSRHVRQSRVDARVVLRVNAEPARADPRD